MEELGDACVFTKGESYLVLVSYTTRSYMDAPLAIAYELEESSGKVRMRVVMAPEPEDAIPNLKLF